MSARGDPVGRICNLDRAVIDEIQRAPQLLLAIKESVDEDRRPGRFLLTGSANLMALPTVADSLAGRMETLLRLPLSQNEAKSQFSRVQEMEKKRSRFQARTVPWLGKWPCFGQLTSLRRYIAFHSGQAWSLLSTDSY